MTEFGGQWSQLSHQADDQDWDAIFENSIAQSLAYGPCQRSYDPTSALLNQALAASLSLPSGAYPNYSSTLFEPPGLHSIQPQTAPDTAYGDMIVAVYRAPQSNKYIFRCCVPECSGTTVSRWPDWTRHDKGFHIGKESFLWCPVPGCKRSNAVGNNGFPEIRKDKLREHMRTTHYSELEDWF
ncbi:uncharacterized protein K460DRAFT_407416 [Cucurbitaria berberidis CBS 394.84]|uniref:Uncharacterized protein n=1 Tax=Cucurbitaria berberidis CBS 394.84 TaxID=1168544 RepID=A0A9P4GBY3_9PLEO|nr:uncharacterized protein K460DRAFT_407416 [Cucurbitaria berberidis CBS 394.84]KAF1843043.1 hypothetical protein K460DRAFT_407416 [Cucurbitaria berberidis CBS 394.84]